MDAREQLREAFSNVRLMGRTGSHSRASTNFGGAGWLMALASEAIEAARFLLEFAGVFERAVS